MFLFFPIISIFSPEVVGSFKNKQYIHLKMKDITKDDLCIETRDLQMNRVHTGPRKKINTLLEIMYEPLKLLNQSQK